MNVSIFHHVLILNINSFSFHGLKFLTSASQDQLSAYSGSNSSYRHKGSRCTGELGKKKKKVLEGFCFIYCIFCNLLCNPLFVSFMLNLHCHWMCLVLTAYYKFCVLTALAKAFPYRFCHLKNYVISWFSAYV